MSQLYKLSKNHVFRNGCSMQMIQKRFWQTRIFEDYTGKQIGYEEQQNGGYSRQQWQTRQWTEAPRVVTCVPGFLGNETNWYFMRQAIKTANDFGAWWMTYDRSESLVECGDSFNASLHDLVKNQMKGWDEETQRWYKKDGKVGPKVDLVVFSMGALVLRVAQQDKKFWNRHRFGKLVLICPTTKGSQWAQKLYKYKFTRKVMLAWAEKKYPWDSDLGKTWDDSETVGCTFGKINSDLIEKHFPFDPSYFEEILVINGRLPLGGNPFLEGENDGSVTTEESRLSEDIKNVKYETFTGQHSMLLYNKKLQNRVAQFLEFGEWEKSLISNKQRTMPINFPKAWPPSYERRFAPDKYARFSREVNYGTDRKATEEKAERLQDGPESYFTIPKGKKSSIEEKLDRPP